MARPTSPPLPRCCPCRASCLQPHGWGPCAVAYPSCRPLRGPALKTLGAPHFTGPLGPAPGQPVVLEEPRGGTSPALPTTGRGCARLRVQAVGLRGGGPPPPTPRGLDSKSRLDRRRNVDDCTKPDTSGLVEYTQANERTPPKELGQLAPYLRYEERHRGWLSKERAATVY